MNDDGEGNLQPTEFYAMKKRCLPAHAPNPTMQQEVADRGRR